MVRRGGGAVELGGDVAGSGPGGGLLALDVEQRVVRRRSVRPTAHAAGDQHQVAVLDLAQGVGEGRLGVVGGQDVAQDRQMLVNLSKLAKLANLFDGLYHQLVQAENAVD